jgi:hypothetical protein
MDSNPFVIALCLIVLSGIALYMFGGWMEAREKTRNKQLDEQMNLILNSNPEAVRSFITFKIHVESAMRQIGSKQCAITFNV